MPYLPSLFWSTVVSYLPDKEQQTALTAMTQLEEENLKAAAAVAEHIFYPKISRSRNLSFVYFNSLLHQSRNVPFKFHISISPEDYELVLYKSDLNKMLQTYLVAPTLEKTLYSFKYVDPTLLKKAKAEGRDCSKYLLTFYSNVEKHNALREGGYAEKFRLYQILKSWHAWFIKSLSDRFPSLNSLLEASSLELELYKKKSFSLLQETADSIKRLEQEVQFTLYVCEGASTENLVSLIQHVSEYLTTMRVRPVPCPTSDLPLTSYVTFRQDRYAVDGTYVFADEEQSGQLKEYAKKTSLYTELSSTLNAPTVEMEFTSFKRFSM
jgi:hypothetical protein